MGRLRLIAGCLIAAGVIFGSGFLLGWAFGNRGTYQMRYEEERDAVAPLINADPAFSGVQIHVRSSGGIYLSGEVPSKADLDRFTSQVTWVLGEPRARIALIGVSAQK